MTGRVWIACIRVSRTCLQNAWNVALDIAAQAAAQRSEFVLAAGVRDCATTANENPQAQLWVELAFRPASKPFVFDPPSGE